MYVCGILLLLQLSRNSGLSSSHSLGFSACDQGILLRCIIIKCAVAGSGVNVIHNTPIKLLKLLLSMVF